MKSACLHTPAHNTDPQLMSAARSLLSSTCALPLAKKVLRRSDFTEGLLLPEGILSSSWCHDVEAVAAWSELLDDVLLMSLPSGNLTSRITRVPVHVLLLHMGLGRLHVDNTNIVFYAAETHTNRVVLVLRSFALFCTPAIHILRPSLPQLPPLLLPASAHGTMAALSSASSNQAACVSALPPITQEQATSNLHPATSAAGADAPLPKYSLSAVSKPDSVPAADTVAGSTDERAPPLRTVKCSRMRYPATLRPPSLPVDFLSGRASAGHHSPAHRCEV